MNPPESLLIGALAGLIPVVLTALLTWIEKRGLEARQNHMLDLAQRRVTFLQAWLDIQRALCSPERFEE